MCTCRAARALPCARSWLRLRPWLWLGLGLGLACAPAASQSHQGFAGDACSGGVCRPIGQCEEARQALLQGRPPALCSYDGFTPVVCCPAATTPRPSPAPAPATPTPTPRPADSPQRLAARMCTKYGEAVYRYENSFHIPPQRVKVDQCALKGVPFIVGGEQAGPNEFPHMALLGYGDPKSPQWACGGSLVSERFVLTAAHCVLTSQGAPVVVRLGELDLSSTAEVNRHEDYAVAQAVMHPEYRDGVYYNDVALLRLARDAAFTASVRPACLYGAHAGEDDAALDAADEAIASGWGFTDWATPEITNHLMKVKLPIHPAEVCQNAYRTLSTTSRLRNGIQGETMVCAGTLQGGKDTCRGDSGGPLQLRLKSPYCMYSVVGITSFGKGNCGTSKSPAIYTRVSHFLPWIESVVWAK